MASLHQLLSPSFITGAISREAAASSPLLSLFGFAPVVPGENGQINNPAGSNQTPIPLRVFSYDIFNDTRTVGTVVSPNSPATTVTRQRVGRVDGTLPKLFMKLPLNSDELYQFKRIGGQQTDYGLRAVQDYIGRQARFLAQKAANFRLLLTAGMMRGQLYAHNNGEEVYYDFTSANSNAGFNIDWQIPAGNKGQLDMLGNGDIITTSWANTGADIPGNLASTDTAFENLYGGRADIAVCNESTWQKILNNDAVQEQAGTVNTPFESFVRQVGNGINGMPTTVKEARLRCRDFLRWIITDSVLDLGANGTTRTKLIPDGYVWFGPSTQMKNYEMLTGTSPVIERPGGPETERNGLYSWVMTSYDPPSRQIYVQDNALPALYVPNSTAWAQVIF